jgi:hypothetical protein
MPTGNPGQKRNRYQRLLKERLEKKIGLVN